MKKIRSEVLFLHSTSILLLFSPLHYGRIRLKWKRVKQKQHTHTHIDRKRISIEFNAWIDFSSVPSLLLFNRFIICFEGLWSVSRNFYSHPNSQNKEERKTINSQINLNKFRLVFNLVCFFLSLFRFSFIFFQLTKLEKINTATNEGRNERAIKHLCEHHCHHHALSVYIWMERILLCHIFRSSSAACVCLRVVEREREWNENI